jgi:hypothetical protein
MKTNNEINMTLFVKGVVYQHSIIKMTYLIRKYGKLRQDQFSLSLSLKPDGCGGWMRMVYDVEFDCSSTCGAEEVW